MAGRAHTPHRGLDTDATTAPRNAPPDIPFPPKESPMVHVTLAHGRTAAGAALATLIASVVAAPSARADILFVDGDGGGQFTSLQAAVFAAVDGDTIVVDGGGPLDVYETTFVFGTSLTIVGRADEFGVRPRIDGWLDVRDVPAGGSVVVRGLDIDSQVPGFFALQVLDVAGSFLAEDLVVRSLGIVPGEPSARPALGVFGSPAVHLVGLDVRGTDGAAGVAAGPAGQIVASSVALHGCTFLGGRGADATSALPGSAGGDGLRVFESDVVVARCALLGGDGGAAIDSAAGCTGGGAGGNALDVVTNSNLPARVWHVDTTLASGSSAASGACPAGAPAELVESSGGEVFELPGEVPSVRAPALPRFGASFDLEVAGRPGALAFLGVALAPRYAPVLPLSGVLAIDTGYGLVALGHLDAAGTATSPQLVGDVGVAALRVVVQVATVDPLAFPSLVVGAPSVFTLVH